MDCKMHVITYNVGVTISVRGGVSSLFTMCAVWLIRNGIVVTDNDVNDDVFERFGCIRSMVEDNVGFENNMHVFSAIAENDQCWIVSYKPISVENYFLQRTGCMWFVRVPNKWKVISEKPLEELSLKPFVKKDYGKKTIVVHLGSSHYFNAGPLHFHDNNDCCVTDFHQIFWKGTNMGKTLTFNKVLDNNYVNIANLLSKFENGCDWGPYFKIATIARFWDCYRDELKNNMIFRNIEQHFAALHKQIEKLKPYIDKSKPRYKISDVIEKHKEEFGSCYNSVRFIDYIEAYLFSL